MRRLARAAIGIVVVVVGVVLPAAPAWAHSIAGAQPTNYATHLRAMTPALDGVTVRTVDFGTRLELRNTSDQTVTVLGYEGEPYLRVGPDGVERNTRSPATFLNRTAIPKEAIPDTYDAAATPEWEHISSGNTVRWHDHRTHWMGGSDPPAVQKAPGERHVVIEDFDVPLVLADGKRASVTGDVVWEPGPSPWPWLGLVAVLALIVVGRSRTRWWPAVLGVALVALIAAESVHLFGLWGATTASPITRLLAGVYSEVAVILSIGALVLLIRRSAEEAAPSIVVAALFVTIAGGLADVTALFRSQVPTTLPDDLARTAITVALGVGIGTTIAAGLRLRRAPAGGGARGGARAARSAGASAAPVSPSVPAVPPVPGTPVT